MATQHHRIPHTPWFKPRSCFTASGYAKRRYETRSEAKRVAMRLQAQEGVPMDFYRCDVCGWWHCGHKR